MAGPPPGRIGATARWTSARRSKVCATRGEGSGPPGSGMCGGSMKSRHRVPARWYAVPHRPRRWIHVGALLAGQGQAVHGGRKTGVAWAGRGPQGSMMSAWHAGRHCTGQFWQRLLGLWAARLANPAVRRRLVRVNSSLRLHCMTPPARLANGRSRRVVPAAGAHTHPWPTGLSSARRFTPLS